MAAIALVSSSSTVDWWDGAHGSARKGTKARPASRRSRGAHTDPECLNKCQECGVPVTGWISVTAGGVEHETEHKGQLARAATRKPRVPARTKFPIPRPCASPLTFPSPSWSIDRKRSGRDKYDCNRYGVPYQEIYHRFLPIHQPRRYLCEWGKAVTGVTGMRDQGRSSPSAPLVGGR